MGKSVRANVTPEVRGALLRAFKILEGKGKPLSSIWVAMFEDDPVQAMKLAIATMPKEIQAEVTALAPEDWLEMMADGKREGAGAEEAVQGSVH